MVPQILTTASDHHLPCFRFNEIYVSINQEEKLHLQRFCTFTLMVFHCRVNFRPKMRSNTWISVLCIPSVVCDSVTKYSAISEGPLFQKKWTYGISRRSLVLPNIVYSDCTRQQEQDLSWSMARSVTKLRLAELTVRHIQSITSGQRGKRTRYIRNFGSLDEDTFEIVSGWMNLVLHSTSRVEIICSRQDSRCIGQVRNRDGHQGLAAMSGFLHLGDEKQVVLVRLSVYMLASNRVTNSLWISVQLIGKVIDTQKTNNRISSGCY